LNFNASYLQNERKFGEADAKLQKLFHSESCSKALHKGQANLKI